MTKFRIGDVWYEAPNFAAARQMHEAAGKAAREAQDKDLYNAIGWSERCGVHCTIRPSLELAKVYNSWSALPARNQKRLTGAIQIAPMMVREAIKGLIWLKTQRKMANALGRRGEVRGGPGGAVLANLPANFEYGEVGLALLKYFNLREANEKYWQYVDGIKKVFLQILHGLESSYVLELGVFSCNGRVAGQGFRTSPVSKIRSTFGFTGEWSPDSDLHVDYNGHEFFRDIEISYDYLNGYDGPDDLAGERVARTIVHEASHKFANTKDVLYKHKSWGKNPSCAEYRLAEIAIPGREKPLQPIMNYQSAIQEPRRQEPQRVLGDDLIPPEKWLENADSYAWCARRIWKAAGRPVL